MAPACPECGAARGHLLGCSHGTIRLPQPAALEPSPQGPPDADGPAPSPRARALAVGLALCVCWALASTSVGPFFLRTFFGMWLHELGHASAGWLCGLAAVPLPWFTTVPSQRSPAFVVLVVGGLAALALRLRRAGASPLVVLAPVLVALAVLVGSTVPSLRAATAFGVFAGEAGAMVYGALLLAASLAPDDWAISRGGLRWGYLVIGAASWVDATHLWVSARLDAANLPFGLEDGHPSDATRLVDELGWSEAGMVSAFLAVAALSLAPVAALALHRAWRREASVATR